MCEPAPEMPRETVHTVTGWYDGERLGIADYQGRPHLFESRWDPSKDDWEEQNGRRIYWLTPLGAEVFKLALEDWEIWKRWQDSFDQGKVELDTHPALPEEKERHEEISTLLGDALRPGRPGAFMMAGQFSAAEVIWSRAQQKS